MWISLDERRLLAAYSRLMSVGQEKVYRVEDLTPLLKSYTRRPMVKEYDDNGHENKTSALNVKALKKEVTSYIRASDRVELANNLLATRSLITVQKHQLANDVIVVTLTLAGYDLGRKYSSWLIRTGLWFSEYKDHWAWLIVAFLGGILGSLALKGIESVVPWTTWTMPPK